MQAGTSSVRVRIAPSPTGYPHIGTIYQALFNFAYAKKHSGKFLVRIEDTDRTRFTEGAEDVIFALLDWVGLTEDESPRNEGSVGPYRQSERLAIYHKYAEELIQKGHAYYSYFPKKDAGSKKDYSAGRKDEDVAVSPETPPKSIAEMMERGDWVVRLQVPKEGDITVRDEIRGEISFPVKEVTAQVLIKSDGFPTYHLAVVVDDHLMGITHVVRAEEWLSSLPKHKLLYDYFGWEMPPLFHTATLRNPDKSKLSKRHGHTSVTWYKEEGYLPEAILNYLGLLGWSHPEEKEFFSLAEFIELFDLQDVRPVAPIFDLTKLSWMNQRYIMQLSEGELKERLLAHLPVLKEVDEALLERIIPLAQTRMQTLNEFVSLTTFFFAEVQSGEVMLTPKEHNVAKELLAKLPTVREWQRDNLLTVFKTIMQDHGIRMSVLYKIFTGQERGLPLPESLEILSKQQTLHRLERIIHV